ncbi:MAG: glycosyltransferase family 4 protein [Gammaproteobacteria bacterium]|nr:glycosyltransferase family 4 protein [Gammaproteobacteria bacterium]
MRILFLSHYFPPEVNAPASRTLEHCREWVSRGHEVHVLTCVPNHPAGRIYPGFRNRILQHEQIDGIQVHRILTVPAANAGFVGRTANYFFYLLMATVAAPFLSRVDVVVSTSPQFFCGLAGYLVSRLTRVPWVLEIRDLWPESIVTVGAMRESRLTRGLGWMESFAYRKADAIVSVTDSFVPHIEARGGAGKVTVITNGVDLKFFGGGSGSLAGSAELAAEFGVEGKFVAAYVGTHGMAHGLETILHAAERLRDVSNVVFLLVGAGAEAQNLMAKRDAMRLGNVFIVGQQPKDRMPGIWALTDVSLVLLRKHDAFEAVIPSKIFEAMGMARPIILGVRGESQRIVAAAGAGICIEPENDEELANAVQQLALSPEQARSMGESGRRYAEQNYDRRRLAVRFEQLLARVASGPPSGSATNPSVGS